LETVTKASVGSFGANVLLMGSSYLLSRVIPIIVVLIAVAGVWSTLAWGAAQFLIVDASLEQAEAVAILSGSGVYIERTSHAAELFKKKRGRIIILTNDNEKGGWSSEEQRNPFHFELARAELLNSGIPADRIMVIVQPVSGTGSEALLLRQYSEAKGLKSLLVVTSAYHSRRALWTLKKVFAGSSTEVGLEAVGTGGQTPDPLTWWLHWSGWQAVPVEYVKLVYYRLRGVD